MLLDCRMGSKTEPMRTRRFCANRTNHENACGLRGHRLAVHQATIFHTPVRVMNVAMKTHIAAYLAAGDETSLCHIFGNWGGSSKTRTALPWSNIRHCLRLWLLRLSGFSLRSVAGLITSGAL